MGIIIGILNVVVVLLSLFLIGIILIQRGKGGGLAGAFGGVGGSSAFGTKAGDVFTKITVGLAIGWIILLMMMVIMTNQHNSSAWDDPAAGFAKDSDSKSSKSKSKSSAAKDDLVPNTLPGSNEEILPPDFPTAPVLPEQKSTPTTTPASPPATAPASPPATTPATPPATTPANPPAKAPK
jgi:preprotein translocase subunit SecG